MTHVTCRLTAKDRDQLRSPTLGSRVRATFTFRSQTIFWSQTKFETLVSAKDEVALRMHDAVSGAVYIRACLSRTTVDV